MPDKPSQRRRIAFITPRYGSGVVGGAELMASEAAFGLADRGHDVEILTTCASDHYNWKSVFAPGVTAEGPITLRRFAIFPGADQAGWIRLQQRLVSGEVLTEAEELTWVNGRFRVPDLYLYLADAAEQYDALVFTPYLLPTSLYCAGLSPERTILMPCLHDEAYAHLKSVRAMLAGAAAVWFLSEPEHRFGHRLAPLPEEHPVIGGAVQVPTSYDSAGFRKRHGLERPFVLYAGRREEGKGWNQVLSGFALAIVRGRLPFDLVTFGVGEPNVPAGLESRVVDLGYLDSSEVPDAFAAAACYLQPSLNESFSRTIMDAWLAGTLVVANGGSDVVAWHCERSGAGIVYRDELELAECLRFVAESPGAVAEIAARGRDYVLSNYTWPRVLDAMESSLEALA